MNTYETFKQLHQSEKPLLLGNFWDVNSATLFEASGFKAIGTSSQAVAKALGSDDGENIPFEWLLQLARRVVERVRIPVTIDIEGGYARTVDSIVDNLSKLHDAGVVGINIEDTIPGASRVLRPVSEFQKMLSAIVESLSKKNVDMFINVRTDGFLLGLPDAREETLKRIAQYEDAGVCGIFVPCITAVDDIKAVVAATTLPINVMCMPQLPDFATLETLGVKRISMGPFLNVHINNKITQTLAEISSHESFAPLFT